MTATYDISLSTDKDWIRFKIGDTDVDNPGLQDETILAIIAESPNKWIAAAESGEALLGLWSTRGKGIAEKQVERLRIKYSEGRSILEVYERYLNELRSRGNTELLKPRHVFKVISQNATP